MAFFALVILLHVSEIFCAKDTVRIVEGGPYEGIVEVFVSPHTSPDDEWSRVCDTSWSMTEADVVCRQLGHPGAMWNVSSLEYDDDGVDGSWICDVQCNGDERTIHDCHYNYSECIGDSCKSAKITCNYADYLGCFETREANPLLKGKFTATGKMTIEYCLEFCRDSEYLYAGVQESYRCFCDFEFSNNNTAEPNEMCHSKCIGKSSQACGGRNKFVSKFIGVYPTSMGDCGGIVKQNRGTVYSPGFPGEHFRWWKDQECTWKIYGPSGTVLESEFIMFDLDHQYTIEIIDMASNNEQIFTDETDQSVEPTTSNKMKVNFLYKARGNKNKVTAIFALEWKAVWKCHNNQTVENGYIFPMGEYMYTPGETLALECHQGYYPSTNFIIVTCLEDGTWDGSLSDCIIVSCGDPGDPDQGVKFGDNFTYDSRIHFSCDEGYELNGTDTIVCQANGTWSDDPPTCMIINCGEPEDIDNADKHGDTFTYDNTVSYTCHDKYVLEDGNGTVVCGEDGEWSDAPTCVPSEETEDSNSLYIAAVGGLLGILVLIGFIVAMVLLFRRSKYHQSKTNEPPADNFPSGSTNDSQPMHDCEALQNSRQMNNTKNDRPTTNHSQLNTNPAFDGGIPKPIFSKDIVDDSVHHQTGDNVTGHVYNDIDCSSKTDSQSGFVENDLYRPCSFGPDSTGARPEFQVKLTDNILYESSDHDMVDSKGDGVYYSAIGNGETVEMKDNIAYESASLRQ